MPLSTNTQLWKILLVIFIALSAIFSLCFYFKNIFITLVIGITIALITEKFIEGYAHGTAKYRGAKWRKRFYGYATSFFWFGAIIFLVWNSISNLSDTFDKYSTTKQTISISESLLKLNPYLPSIGGTKLISKDTALAAQHYLNTQFNTLLSDISFIAFNSLFVVPIVLYMYFRKKDKLSEALMSSVPHRFAEATRRAVRDIGKQLGDFFSAKIIQSVIVGAIACLGFFIAGVQGWLVFGVIVGILNIIPYVGPLVSILPPVFSSIILGDPLAAYYSIIVVLVAAIIDNVYIVPFMIPSKVSVDPLLSIILVLIGGELFGLTGILFAIPIYLIYKVVLKESYEELAKLYGK